MTALEKYLDPDNIRQAVEELGAPGYESLHSVLRRAFAQAAHGKGAERHAQGAPFDQQPMQRLCELYGVGFALGQAAKKAQESQRLPHERAVAELLGAINYIAGAIIHMERQHQTVRAVPDAANDNTPASTAAEDIRRKRAAMDTGECQALAVALLCDKCRDAGRDSCPYKLGTGKNG